MEVERAKSPEKLQVKAAAPYLKNEPFLSSEEEVLDERNQFLSSRLISALDVNAVLQKTLNLKYNGAESAEKYRKQTELLLKVITKYYKCEYKKFLKSMTTPHRPVEVVLTMQGEEHGEKITIERGNYCSVKDFIQHICLQKDIDEYNARKMKLILEPNTLVTHLGILQNGD